MLKGLPQGNLEEIFDVPNMNLFGITLEPSMNSSTPYVVITYNNFLFKPRNKNDWV